jgi:hypothetical protein
VLPFAARASTCSSHADEADAGASTVGTTRIPGVCEITLAVKVSWMNGLWRRNGPKPQSYLDRLAEAGCRGERAVNG